MLNKNNTRLNNFIALSLAAGIMAVSGQSIAAKGSGGGRTFDIAYSTNGACTKGGVAVDALPRIVLRSSRGVIYYILETIGTASAGTWNVTFTTQFISTQIPSSVSTIWKDLPEGWAVVGGQLPGSFKFANLGVVSTDSTGVSCTATLYKKF